MNNLKFSSKEFIVYETYHIDLHAISITAIDKKSQIIISQNFISLYHLTYYVFLVYEFIASLQHKSLIYINFGSFLDGTSMKTRAKLLLFKLYDKELTNIILTYSKSLELQTQTYLEGSYQDINFTALLPD